MGKGVETNEPRSLLSSTPSVASLPILSSKSREPSVYIATRVEGQRRPVINVCLRRDALHESLKKKKKKIRKGEKGEGTKGEGIEEKVTKGVDSPLFFLRANNNTRRPASFKILKHDCTGCMQGGALPFKPFSNHRGANSIDAKKTQKLAYTLQIIPQLY